MVQGRVEEHHAALRPRPRLVAHRQATTLRYPQPEVRRQDEIAAVGVRVDAGPRRHRGEERLDDRGLRVGQKFGRPGKQLRVDRVPRRPVHQHERLPVLAVLLRAVRVRGAGPHVVAHPLRPLRVLQRHSLELVPHDLPALFERPRPRHARRVPERDRVQPGHVAPGLLLHVLVAGHNLVEVHVARVGEPPALAHALRFSRPEPLDELAFDVRRERRERRVLGERGGVVRVLRCAAAFQGGVPWRRPRDERRRRRQERGAAHFRAASNTSCSTACRGAGCLHLQRSFGLCACAGTVAPGAYWWQRGATVH